MIGNTAKKAGVRKNWVTPELKKIDIETDHCKQYQAQDWQLRRRQLQP